MPALHEDHATGLVPEPLARMGAPVKTHLVKHSPHCDEHGLCTRSAKHDAYYCALCDEWAERQCVCVDCEFCAGRPEKPSEVEK